MTAVKRVITTISARRLREAAAEAAATGVHLVVIDDEIAPDDAAIELLLAPLAERGVASASPLPVDSGGLTTYPLHDALPPAPTLVAPWRRLCGISCEALATVPDPPARDTFDEQLVAFGERLLQLGWRHVAAPGLSAGWDAAPAPPTPAAAWTASTIAGLVGPANAGLEAHVAWAQSRRAGTTVVIDGACLGGDLHTGTQHVVLNVSRWLKVTRPDAEIVVAAPSNTVEEVGMLMAGSGVDVVERNSVRHADVLYRPYQMLRGGELAFVERTGNRMLVGQLDMIGFSNPFYHPSPQLFAYARNLQRHMMRTADGVTFISDFGRRAALAECPDLEPRRLHVVSCGADPVPVMERSRPALGGGLESFIACVSATFWHKNRGHAVATFASLVEQTGYPGALVIVGPEPYYGRSTAADDALLDGLPEKVRDRVHRWGQVTDAEKWWLLEHADAVLYPSIVEGFGLIPFEAAAVGTPSLAYEGTAPGEVLAGTGAVISSWAPSDWARRLADWIADSDRSREAVDEIMRAAQGLTWRSCAERTWQAIDATIARPRRTLHTEEGGYASRVADARRVVVRGTEARFFVARAQPAIARRLRRAWAGVTDARRNRR